MKAAQQLHAILSSTVAMLLLLLLAAISPAAYAELSCPPEHRIEESFANGAAWSMCWESKKRENIVLSEASFQPPDGAPISIFSTLRLSQLHVAYDDANVTYNDVTQFGLGAGYMSTLDAADCPAGELIPVMGRAGMCKLKSVGDDAYRTPNGARMAESLTLFSVSQVGSYAYLVTWKFFDDGSVQPSVGAAGALQRSSDWADSPFGRELEGVPDKSWLSHTHNYYWRIDFDLGDDATDDRVTEVSYPLDAEGRRSRLEQNLTRETARVISPDNYLSWHINSEPNAEPGIDNSAMTPGYIIAPVRYGHKLVRSVTEAFTEFDFFVTKQNDCERFVSENAKYNPDCYENILQFTNDESLENEDIVVWHRISFHHVPRNEDRQTMHSHWDGFVMQAKNLSLSTPGHSGIAENTSPFATNPGDQWSAVNNEVSLTLETSDLDGDPLTYTASGLPEGISIDAAGSLRGIPTQIGTYAVNVNISDSTDTTSVAFDWQIGKRKRESGLGAAGLILVFLFGGLLQRRTGLVAQRLPG